MRGDLAMKALRVLTAPFEDGDQAVVGAECIGLAKGGGRGCHGARPIFTGDGGHGGGPRRYSFGFG